MNKDFAIGQRIRFRPQASNRWWTIRAFDDRYVVATQVAPFSAGDVQYTIVDLTGWDRTYNDVGPGVVRSSLNTLGGGYDVGPDGQNCQQLLDELVAGNHGFSPRCVMAVDAIEVERRPEAAQEAWPRPLIDCVGSTKAAHTEAGHMRTIDKPMKNFDTTDAVLAQSVAADSGWQIDSAGQVYDAESIIVAANLFVLAAAMREVGWFTPLGARATGIVWKLVPAKDERADAVRAQMR